LLHLTGEEKEVDGVAMGAMEAMEVMGAMVVMEAMEAGDVKEAAGAGVANSAWNETWTFWKNDKEHHPTHWKRKTAQLSNNWLISALTNINNTLLHSL
jgi:hypothetical protein